MGIENVGIYIEILPHMDFIDAGDICVSQAHLFSIRKTIICHPKFGNFSKI